MADLSKIKAIVIGGSAGSFQVITEILSSLPEDFSIPIVLALHRLKTVREGFVEALMLKSKLPVIEPDDKLKIKPGKVYLAPSNYHLLMELTYTFALSTEEMVNYSRPSIDLTLQTMGYTYRHRLIGIILSGANKDGAKGLKKIKDFGGYTIIQDPQEAIVSTMPEAAYKLDSSHTILNTNEIIALLIKADTSFKKSNLN